LRLAGTYSKISETSSPRCFSYRCAQQHLRLFSEQNTQGVQASVYNVNARNWIALSESVETIEHGKLKAAAYAEAYLKHGRHESIYPCPS
jgi:hypothetical protein